MLSNYICILLCFAGQQWVGPQTGTSPASTAPAVAHGQPADTRIELDRLGRVRLQGRSICKAELADLLHRPAKEHALGRIIFLYDPGCREIDRRMIMDLLDGMELPAGTVEVRRQTFNDTIEHQPEAFRAWLTDQLRLSPAHLRGHSHWPTTLYHFSEDLEERVLAMRQYSHNVGRTFERLVREFDGLLEFARDVQGEIAKDRKSQNK